MNDVTLKDLVEARFKHLERVIAQSDAELDRRIAQVIKALEKLSIDAVRRERFDSAIHKIEVLQTKVETVEKTGVERDKRINEQAGYVKLWRWILGLMTMIIGAVIIDRIINIIERLQNVP